MIRTIRQEEIRQSLELTQAAFAIRFSESDIEQRLPKLKMEQYLGYYVDGLLAAQLEILPLAIYVQGEKVAMGGIASVSSYPELRRQGMVGKLLVRSLAEMRESGQTVSMLNPFAYGFYRKYGWEYFSVQSVYTLEIGAAPKYPTAPGAVKRLRAEGWTEADAVYDKYAKRYNGMLRRDEDWWLNHVFRRKLGSLAVYYAAGSAEPTGYMLYDIKDRHMNMQELVYLDQESRNGLWQFIRNHDSIISRLKFTAPADEPFLFGMAEPKLQHELHSNFMFRIVDVAAFVKQYRFAEAASGSALHVSLADDHAEWNNGLWEITVSADGRAEAALLAGEASASGAISCSIQTLGAMLIGCQRPAQLANHGHLDGSAEAVAAWEQEIPRQISYMTDFF